MLRIALLVLVFCSLNNPEIPLPPSITAHSPKMASVIDFISDSFSVDFRKLLETSFTGQHQTYTRLYCMGPESIRCRLWSVPAGAPSNAARMWWCWQSRWSGRHTDQMFHWCQALCLFLHQAEVKETKQIPRPGTRWHLGKDILFGDFLKRV